MAKQVNMDLLSNARDSIIMGLEDYESSEPRRLVSCTRNIFAGILLLFKHKLNSFNQRNTEESLIRQIVLPKLDNQGNLIWVGQGKKTVDVQQIQARLNSLGIDVDWKKVKTINDLRNDIEHFYCNFSKDAIRSIIANSFLIIRDFLSIHLNLDARDFLGMEAFNVLSSIAEVYEKEKQDCIKIIEGIDWKSNSLCAALIEYRCDNCGSQLITIKNPNTDGSENSFYCRSCDASWEFQDIAEDAIIKYYSFENYLSFTDGSEPAVINCPNCGRETYILEENICVLCEESFKRECKRCGMEIPVGEIDGSGFCSWCSHMMSRDD